MSKLPFTALLNKTEKEAITWVWDNRQKMADSTEKTKRIRTADKVMLALFNRADMPKRLSKVLSWRVRENLFIKIEVLGDKMWVKTKPDRTFAFPGKKDYLALMVGSLLMARVS